MTIKVSVTGAAADNMQSKLRKNPGLAGTERTKLQQNPSLSGAADTCAPGSQSGSRGTQAAPPKTLKRETQGHRYGLCPAQLRQLGGLAAWGPGAPEEKTVLALGEMISAQLSSLLLDGKKPGRERMLVTG